MAWALTTTALVKSWLTISSSGDDTIIDEIIADVTRAFKNFTGRQLESAAFTETLNGKNVRQVPLKNTPITAVSAVTVDGTSILSTSVSTTYGFMFDDDYIYIVASRLPGFTRGLRNIVIAYTGGYTEAALPDDIKQLARVQAAFQYKGRTRTGEITKTLPPNQSVTFETGRLLESVKTGLLDGGYVRRARQ